MTEHRPHLIEDIAKMRSIVRHAQAAGKRVGLIPTMGALHDGHLSLVRAAQAETDVQVATIFVNPTQFGPGEDFQRYPRTLEQDLAALAALHVDYVFVPQRETMYPPDASTTVSPPRIAEPLEGQIRPGHFRGVATVVLKLFHIVPADIAYFGQKDFQQAQVIRRMVADLNVPMKISICPIVRETDGLALSSRNTYLSADERSQATVISRALDLAQQMRADGETDATKIQDVMKQQLLSAGIREIDYVAIANAETLTPIQHVTSGNVALIAVRVGTTRLIDNCILG